MSVTIDLQHCTLTVFPKINRVAFVSKWTGRTESLTVPQLIKILKRLSAAEKGSQ